MAKDDNIYFCIACGKEHREAEFYRSSNPLHKNGRLPYCKKAIRNFVLESPKEVNVSRFQSFLRQIDVPYVHSIYVSAVEGDRETVGSYFTKINGLPQYSKSTWKESEFEEIEIDGEGLSIHDDFYITKEMEFKWGNGLQPFEYQFLESKYKEIISSIINPTPVQISLIGHLSRAELRAYQAKDSSTKEYNQAVKLVTDLHSDLNIAPSQQKDLSESEEAWGMFIKRIENEEPIDEWDDENDFAKDVMGTFKFMIGHIAKMIGKQNPYEEEYDETIRDNSATLSSEDSDG